MSRQQIDADTLRQIEETSPEAARLVAHFKERHRRGRRPIPEHNFRQLQLWWKSFRKHHSDIPLNRAWAKFLNRHGEEIAKLLQIKRHDLRSFLNAVARGAAETERIRQHRRSAWQIVPRGLFGHSLTTDPDMAAYLRAAQEYALLGTGPLRPLVG
jgi:hypothetical protein